MPIVKLNQKTKRIEISSFEISNSVAFSYFNNLPSSERDSALTRAIQIGVLAQKEDRLSAFLASTANELGTELENLKLLFDLKQELFSKSSAKGIVAENQVADYLNEYFDTAKLNDKAELTGTQTGSMKRNKTGDIVCAVDGNEELRIIVECKFDKSIRTGDIATKDIFARRSDTIWSQLLEATANRDGVVSIIVLDASSVDGVILREVANVGFIPAVGFIAIVDSMRGDFTNLGIAYVLARNIALNAKDWNVENDVLQMIVSRLLKDMRDLLDLERLVQQNIENNKEILRTLKKALLSIELSFDTMKEFMRTGEISKQGLLEFYSGEKIRTKFSELNLDIEGL